MQLSTAIELLEIKQKNAKKCAYINSCVRVQKRKNGPHRVSLDITEDSLVLKLSILKLDEIGNPRKNANGKLMYHKISALIDTGATDSCVAKG